MSSGPRRPPSPETAWQNSQPFSRNRRAPSTTSGRSLRTIDAGSGGAVKSGDQSARSPATQKFTIVVHMNTRGDAALRR